MKAAAHILTGLPHAARDHCLAPSRTVDAPTGGARYGRMFPGLRPCPTPPPSRFSRPVPAACAGAASERTTDDRDDARNAAGWPFFGQLIAHDITADRSPVGPHPTSPTLRNARSPKLNLEMIYGDGPVGIPTSTTSPTRPACCSAPTVGTCPATARASR